MSTSRNIVLTLAASGLLAVSGCAATARAGTTTTRPAVTTAAAPSTPSAPSTTGAPVGPARPPSADGANLAGRLASQTAQIVAGFSTSRYDHRQVPKGTPASGAFVTDCSGFVNHVVAGVDPAALAQVPTTNGRTKPRAGDYARFLANPPAGSRWRNVAHVADLVPGDLVAWALPPGAKDTGHILIVRGAPTQMPQNPGAWLVPITDTTASPHGSDDSRNGNPRNQIDPDNGKRSGVGTGTIVLITDADGRPTSYRWSPNAAGVGTPPLISLGALAGT